MSKDISQIISWVLYDAKLVYVRSNARVPFFQQTYLANADGITNMDLAGCLPDSVTFEVERFEISILSSGTAKSILSSFPFARVSFTVADKIYGDWPLSELVRLRREITRTKTAFGDKVVEKRIFAGVSIERHLLLEPRIRFGMYVDFAAINAAPTATFFLCAMLHGVKTRPLQ